MAKLFVIESEGTKVPFLRGILTRSLQDAGLGFEEAYECASLVRDDLSNESEIASWELREMVVQPALKIPREHLSDERSREVGQAHTT